MENKVKIGFIGAGEIGTVHMQEFSQFNEVELTSVMNRSLPIAKTKAEEYGINWIFSKYEDLIFNDQVDAVVISTPNNMHTQIAIQALQAGKHVLLEKPMGMNAEEAKEIVKVQKETGMVLMVGHNRRWAPLNLYVKKQIEQGFLGNIYCIKAGCIRRKGIPGWGSWFTKKSESGGGALIDIGVHMLDLAIWLMGDVKPVSVFGKTFSELGPLKCGIGTWGKPNWDGYFDVDDLAMALIKMDNGSIINLEVSWAAYTDTDSQPYLDIMGAKGGFSIRGDKGKYITEIDGCEIVEQIEIPNNGIGARQMMIHHFIDCIRNGKQPLSSAMSGFINNLVLDAIYKSSITGDQLKINE